MEKTWYLNGSRSKRLSIGVDLERQLSVSAVIEGNTGIGVRLDASQLKELLSPGWMAIVLQHIKYPQSPGLVRELKNLTMSCAMIHERNGGLKISTVDDEGKHMYVILGEVSCKLLFMYAPAILYRVNAYCDEVMRIAGWLQENLTQLRALVHIKGPTQLTMQGAIDIISTAATKMSAIESAASLHWETEFQFDMFYRHREFLANMLIDLMDTDPDQDL
jgi:hypothetical protein